jgi:hypothetical protein
LNPHSFVLKKDLKILFDVSMLLYVFL